MAPRLIYHMCRAAEWEAAKASGTYDGSSQDRADGFIHFSTAAQLPASAARHRAGQPGLVLLAVEVAALGSALRWEPSRGGSLFPHLYGGLPVAAVTRVEPMPLDGDGVPVGAGLGRMMFDAWRAATRLAGLLPPERAHALALRAAALRLAPAAPAADPILQVRLWGFDFPSPVGLAAGFDKDAAAFAGLLRLGFGFVETGTVTPRPQAGNPKPRLFRLHEDAALINRLGFNGSGMAAAARRLARRRRDAGIVGVNIGRNRDSADAGADFEQGVVGLGPLADYLVVNISSPNTPGLRELQRRSAAAALLDRILAARAAACGAAPPPLLVKIAPDLSAGDLADIATVALEARVDGLVVANTTVARPDGLRSRHAHEPGGLSGAPLFAASTRVLRQMFRLTEGRIPLIGVGGVASGEDAYAKIRAGASLVQLYTALVYHGPGLVRRINAELAALLRRDGVAAIGDAVGADAEDHPLRRVR